MAPRREQRVPDFLRLRQVSSRVPRRHSSRANVPRVGRHERAAGAVLLRGAPRGRTISTSTAPSATRSATSPRSAARPRRAASTPPSRTPTRATSAASPTPLRRLLAGPERRAEAARAAFASRWNGDPARLFAPPPLRRQRQQRGPQQQQQQPDRPIWSAAIHARVQVPVEAGLDERDAARWRRSRSGSRHRAPGRSWRGWSARRRRGKARRSGVRGVGNVSSPVAFFSGCVFRPSSWSFFCFFLFFLFFRLFFFFPFLLRLASLLLACLFFARAVRWHALPCRHGASNDAAVE